ncbi:MAG: hypothetical protein Q9225_007885 [Loekoesia sp. 1 TL-2023]
MSVSQAGTDDSPEAASPLNEYFAHQLSHKPISFPRQERQQCHKKQNRPDVTNDKENVQVTISEDLADGQTAKFDKCLKLLRGDDLKLLLPNNLDAGEIHIIEEGSHALQDYQMQLMLLEQQNKKRLLMARQEQEQDGRGPLSFDEVAAKELKRRHQTGAVEMKPPKVGQTPESSLDIKTLQVKRKIPALGADKGTAPAARRQKSGTKKRSDSSSVCRSDSIDGSGSSATQVGTVECMPHKYDLLYRISCSEKHRGIHAAPAFRDVPVVTKELDYRVLEGSEREHLSGKVPVVDLQAYMENDTDDIAFVAIRTVECSQASVLKARAGGPLRWTEAVFTKSNILKEALQAVATCYFQPSPRELPPPGGYNNSASKRSGDTESLSVRNQIDPADLFLFHHRDLLRNYARAHPETKSHIDALLGYTDRRFGAEFEEASSLFARGVVDKGHILYLFKPNELVVSGTYGKPAAFVLQEWPFISSTGWVTLPCWSFQSDGHGFARKRSYLEIVPIETKTMTVQDLMAYPLHFATQELRRLI